MKKLFGLSLVLVIGLASCTTEMSFTKKMQADLQKGDMVLVIPQSNLDVTVPSSNAGNTGLLGALVMAGVDAARQADAQKAAAPIIAALQDYDFRTVMQTALNTALPTITATNFGTEVKLEKVNSNSQRRIDFDKTDADAVLFIVVGYTLQTGNLNVTATVTIYPKSEKMKTYRASVNAPDPVDGYSYAYRKEFSFAKQGINPDNIRPSLDESAQSIADQIAADLNNPRDK